MLQVGPSVFLTQRWRVTGARAAPPWGESQRLCRGGSASGRPENRGFTGLCARSARLRRREAACAVTYSSAENRTESVDAAVLPGPEMENAGKDKSRQGLRPACFEN